MWVPGGQNHPDPKETRKPGETGTCPRLAGHPASLLKEKSGPRQESEDSSSMWLEAAKARPPFCTCPSPCLASHLCSEATKDSAQPRSQAQPPTSPPHTLSSPKAPGYPGWAPKHHPRTPGSPPLAFPPAIQNGWCGQPCALCQQRLPWPCMARA